MVQLTNSYQRQQPQDTPQDTRHRLFRKFRYGLPRPLKNSKYSKFRPLIVLIILVIAGLFLQSYIKTRNELKRLSSPKQASEITSAIGEYLILPENETPTVAQVNDATELKDQPFFKNVQDGDQILIYESAGRAVIYRPSSKKVVEYTSITPNK